MANSMYCLLKSIKRAKKYGLSSSVNVHNFFSFKESIFKTSVLKFKEFVEVRMKQKSIFQLAFCHHASILHDFYSN
jgi:hypothetical protein